MKFDNNFNEVKIRHVLAICVITSIILIIVSIIIGHNLDGEVNNRVTNYLNLLSGILLFIMLMYEVKLSREKANLLYIDFKSKFKAKEITWIIIFYICLNLGLVSLVTYVLYFINPSFANEAVNNSPISINSMTDYLVCFVVMVMLSPIVNEIVFRYVLFKRLSKKFNVYIGIIVSSIIFSAFDVSPEMIGTLALGIINCVLYVKYENLLIPMFVYFMNNLLYMIIYIPINGFKTKNITLTPNSVTVNAVIGLVLVVIGIVSFAKFVIKNKECLKEYFYRNKNVLS